MANHAKAWDAKLLAYVLLRQNTVAGLPGGFTSPISSSGTASEIALVLLEDDTMVKYLITMTLGVFFVLIFAMGVSDAIVRGKSGGEGDIKIEESSHTDVAGPEEQVTSLILRVFLVPDPPTSQRRTLKRILGATARTKALALEAD
jgi:hypothetical protein